MDILKTKRCAKCGDKPIEAFGRDSSQADGLSRYCKPCSHEFDAKYRAKNPEKAKAKTAKWRSKNREKVRVYSAKWQEENHATPERLKSRRLANARYRAKHPDKDKASKEKYRANNPEKVKDIRNKYENKRRKSDPSFLLYKSMSNSLRAALKRSSKFARTWEVIGCTKEFFMNWIQSQFKRGMNWNNYGTKWHIDHKVGKEFFDHRIPEQVRVCWNWRNLRPLWAKQNIRNKHNKKRRQKLAEQLGQRDLGI